MKIIIAYIRPETLQNVKHELYARQVYSMSVTNILGSGRQKGYTEMYRGVTTQVTLLKKIRLEICIDDKRVDEVMEAVVKGARTGHEGDGVIYVVEALRGLRIRTGENLTDTKE